ncbi:hypothetical protein CRG98_024179 [Punica granatum]|uniref:Uncharacterized protein n=1 Tax=Punica granatum TaxID=22663 RepID=A0A2I0JIG9_PUNGR|nr:hypothetical protein CRG98_024179 [Punica granatum]
MLPSLDVRGKESGKRPWESQDSGRRLRVGDPRRRQPQQFRENGSARLLRPRHDAREFGDFWFKSGRVVAGIPSDFPSVLAGFGLGMGCARMRERAGGPFLGAVYLSVGRASRSLVKKGVYEGSGCPGLSRMSPERARVYLVPLAPGDSMALDLRVVNNKWRLLITRVYHASPGRWTLPSRVA